MPSFRTVGLGGGGAMFAPQISPADPQPIFVACDMSGLYRSGNGGSTWSLLDERVVQGTAFYNGLGSPNFGFSVAFHPTQPWTIVGACPYQELKRSQDHGVTWSAFPNAPADFASGGLVTAAAYDPDGNLVVGYSDSSATSLYIFDATNSTWKNVTFGTSTYISRIVTVKDPSGKNFYFAAVYDSTTASNDNVLRYDGTQWLSITNAPGFPNAPRRVLDLAGSYDTNGYAVFATINTNPGPSPITTIVKFTAANAWTSAIGNLTENTPGFYYDHLTMPFNDSQTVYLSGFNPNGNPPFSVIDPPNVWITTNGGGTWTGIYNGNPNYHAILLNVIPEGWNEADSTWGWGFGGSALGLCVAPSDPQTVVFTNLAVVHMTNNGKAGDENVVRWHQIYTGQTGAGNTWRSIGLEVTATWDYVISGNNHFILYTDIGLARSSDGGSTWTSAAKDTNGKRWDNWYQIINVNGQLFAAVSELHNLPFDENQWRSGHRGAVLQSGNNGVDWSPVTGTNLPTNLPVTSLAFGTVKNLPGVGGPSLLACVWDQLAPGQGGVYHSEDMGSSWSGPLPGIISSQTPARCYRVLFDANGDLYCVVSLPGGNVYRWDPNATDSMGNPSPQFSQVPGLATVFTYFGGQQFFHPLDLTTRKASTGTIELYLGTAGVQHGNVSQLFKFDGAAWGNVGLQGITQYVPFPNFFGAYFYDPNVYLTSIGQGTWIAPIAQVDGISKPTPSWTEVGLPFLRTLRVRQDGSGNFYFTTFGSGVWTTS